MAGYRGRSPCRIFSEVEGQLHCLGPRRHVVRPAEGGKEIVQRLLVCQVDNREAEAPLVAVGIKEVVMAHANVEQVPWRNALRIVVVVFLARRRGRSLPACGSALQFSSSQ
jgi:hypothetical protein